MAGDPDPESRMETIARRIEFVELLDEEGPLPPRDVVEALDYSRGTVTRALRELREAGLVEKRAGGYATTLAAAMAAREYRRYENASRAILAADDLLAAIPRAHAPPVEVLVGADAIRTGTELPVRALEAVSDRVREADAVRAYLPTLVNTHLLRVWHRAVVAGAGGGEAVFDPDLLTVLKGQYPHLLSEMAAAEGFAAFAATGPPYGMFLTTADETTTLALVVYEDDAGVRGVLRNDSPGAVEWGRAELDRLAAGASEVTADLDALSAAVADGVARSAPGGAVPGPSTHDGNGSTGTGHALPIDLEAEGFVRLSAEYFDAHGEADPAVSWRTGFTLAEVRAGHPVDRHDAEGRSLTDHLLGSLRSGTDHVVLGPPGSGKSTVCMAVACEWFDRGLGPVCYRERGGDEGFASPALLEAYLRRTDGHALVVVEDAVREEANAVFGVMQALDDAPEVSVLLDARTHEWRNADAFDLDPRLDAYRRTAVEEVSVPALDERECERFVAHFSDLVDDEPGTSGAELFERVEAGTASDGEEGLPAGEALVAQHYLARRYDPSAGDWTSGATALDDAARRTYRHLLDAGASLAPDLAVLVALLTAAGVPVAREYCYAVAADDEYAAIEEALALLKGHLLFERDRPRAGSPAAYRTRHETWALRFLGGVLDLEGTGRARERFGRCVTRLLALADDPARRERIERHLGGRVPHLHRIAADPGGWADELVERIFGVGRTDASLAPLFGETTDDAIALPDACSAWTRLRGAHWRGEMNRTGGDLARAEREFRTLGELAETVGIPPEEDEPPAPPGTTSRHVGADDASAHRTRWRATSRTNLGSVARERGEYGTAEKYHREALALFREVGDREGEARSLKNLGVVAFYRSDFDLASEYYRCGLDIARDIDAKRIEADCLNNLSGIAWKQGDYDRAREHLERSLAISRDLGDRRSEFRSLNNLGEIAQAQGDYDRACEHYEGSLAIFRDLGDREGEARSLNNLGLVAKRQGDYDRAREHYEGSLAVKRDLGDRQGEARSLNNLGEVTREQGDYDRAREHFERALAIERDLGDREGEAISHENLGVVASHRDDHDEAREHFERALDIARDIDARAIEGHCLAHLGLVAGTHEYERASEHLDAALETFEAIGSRTGIARTRLVSGRVALARGDADLARDQATRAREAFAELGATHWEGRSRLLLGRVAAAEGALDGAREHWRAALETFEAVAAPQDALATLAELVATCREEGDEDRAREWLARARDLLADAPDATAADHREWVERHAAGLDAELDGE